MSLYEYAWSRTFEITQKKPAELKLLLSSRLDHSRLIRDDVGYRIVLAKPRKKSPTGYFLHGLRFPMSEQGAVLQMFSGSIYHLGIHVVSSDYSIYGKWSEDKDRHVARFIRGLIEDTAADAYLKAYWRGLRSIIAFANALSFMRLKAVDRRIPSSLSTFQAVLSLRLGGVVKGRPSKKDINDAKKVVDILTGLECSIYEKCRGSKSDLNLESRLEPTATAQERLDAASDIWEILRFGNSPMETLGCPYGDDGGKSSVFGERIDFGVKYDDVLRAAYSRLDMDFDEEEFSKERSRFADEAIQVFDAQEVYDSRMRRRLGEYVKMGQGLHFKAFSVPVEDYSEFMRVRGRLAGSIRRVLDELSKVKQVNEESTLEESGAVDLQAAIQVMASENTRNDIFVKEELLQKSESWAILIDSSLSLGLFKGDVKSIAVCLAEVAKNMISKPDSWGLFAFNDTFQIIKDIDEHYSNRVRAKIGGLQHSGLSLLPDAIELTAKALSKTSEDVKILLIVTDGVSVGYSGIEERFMKSIGRARRDNVMPIIIGIGNKNVKRLLKTSCTVENTHDLMNQFVKIYREAQAYI